MVDGRGRSKDLRRGSNLKEIWDVWGSKIMDDLKYKCKDFGLNSEYSGY